MTDNWDDDSDDDWDIGSEDEDELDKRLGLTKISGSDPKNDFEDEQDLAVAEKAALEKAQQQNLKTKGKALAAKRAAEQDRKEEEELVRKTMELESQMEANMSAEERRMLAHKRVEEADNALTDDLFGGVDNASSNVAGGGKVQNAGDIVKMKDLKDHLKHARKVAQCMKVGFCISNLVGVAIGTKE